MLPEQSIEFRYDTQLLIDGYEDLDEDEVFDYIAENFKGDSLLAVGGDGDPIKWKIWTVRQEVCRGNGLSYEKSILWGQLLQDALFALTINSQAAIKKIRRSSNSYVKAQTEQT